MEHIYTIKVKRQFDPRGLYPSERRYSASTVAGLAWLHLALAATAALLAGLALHEPGPARPPGADRLRELIERAAGNGTPPAEDAFPEHSGDGRHPALLALAPALLAAGALAAGLAAVLASRRWYVDRNIAWFFACSALAALLALAALCLVAARLAAAGEGGLEFCDYFSDGNLSGKVEVVPDGGAEGGPPGNGSWLYVITVPARELRARGIPPPGARGAGGRGVLAVNILIAAAVEALWALLSLRVAWRGMRADYPEDARPERRRPTVRVLTEIRGNNTRHLPKNTKILPPQPDLIEHYPKNDKIRKFFRTQHERGGFFLRSGGLPAADCAKGAELPQRESSAEYRERMLDFLNRCAAGAPEPSESAGPSEPGEEPPAPDRVSWGDVHDHPVYDQNTLDLNEIRLTFERRKAEAERGPATAPAPAPEATEQPEPPQQL